MRAAQGSRRRSRRPVKRGRLLCLLSWRRKKVGRPPGRDPANGTPINGKPLVSISKRQILRKPADVCRYLIEVRRAVIGMLSGCNPTYAARSCGMAAGRRGRLGRRFTSSAPSRTRWRGSPPSPVRAGAWRRGRVRRRGCRERHAHRCRGRWPGAGRPCAW